MLALTAVNDNDVERIPRGRWCAGGAQSETTVRTNIGYQQTSTPHTLPVLVRREWLRPAAATGALRSLLSPRRKRARLAVLLLRRRRRRRGAPPSGPRTL